MKRIVKKKLRGGQVVVPVNSLEIAVYVNFTVTGNAITAATSTDSRVTVTTTDSGTITLAISQNTSTPVLSTLKDYSLFGYNGTTWAEIPRQNIDTGGSAVQVYGSTRDTVVRKQAGTGKIAGAEVVVPTASSSFGNTLQFINIADSIFGFTLSGTPNAHIKLVFTSNYQNPATKWTGWLPTSIPGLTLWLDGLEPAANGSIQNLGTAVSSWRDKSGRNNHASTGTLPTFNTNTGATGTNKFGMYFNGTKSFSGTIQNDNNYCAIFTVIGPDLVAQTTARVLSMSSAVGTSDSAGTNTSASVAVTSTAAATSTQIVTSNSSVSATSYAVDSSGNKLCVTSSWINNTSACVLVNGVILATFTGSIATPANAASSTLTVTAVAAGIITIGMVLSGASIPANTTLIAQLTGPTGGIGTYTVILNTAVSGSAQSIASTTITGVSTTPISAAANPNMNLKAYSIGKNNSNANFYKGYVHEVLVYTQPLTKIGRQTVEGYLAWKWGITLNAAHPFAPAAPLAGAPTLPIPTIFPNIKPLVWLDGQDPLANEGSTFPANSTTITGWYDKSGKNNHAVSITKFAPTYLANSIVFNRRIQDAAQNPTYLYSPISTPITKVVHVFIVCANSGKNRNITSILSMASSTNTETYSAATQAAPANIAEDAKNATYIGLYNDNGYRNVYRNNLIARTVVADNAVRPPELLYFSSNETTISLRVGGNTATTTTGTFPYFSIGAYGLGLQPSNINRLAAFAAANNAAALNYAYDGSIYEVIIYTTDLTALQYQLLEGYLGSKWGITLANSHPYYVNSPLQYFTVVPTAIGTMTFTNITATGFTLSWTGGDNATLYRYSVTPSANNGVSNKSAVFTLPTNVTNTITVTPSNGVGDGTAGTAILLKTPAAPTISGSSGSGFIVTIPPIPGAVSYNIYLNGTKYIPNSSSGNTFTFTSLAAGTGYSVTITAVSSTGQESMPSTPIIGATITQSPNNFRVFNYTGTDTNIGTKSGFSLSWSGGGGATSYTITTSPVVAGQPASVNLATKTAIFTTGFTNTTAYTITVIAVISGVSSDPGTLTILPAPSGLSVPAAPTADSFTLQIGTPVANATGYNIYMGGYAALLNTPLTTIPFTQQPSGALLRVTARSVFNGVEGWPYNSYTETTIAGTGSSPDAGNGGLATAADLSGPTYLATDPIGNIYVLCGEGIRRITTDGMISLFYSGSITGNFSFVVDPFGNLYTYNSSPPPVYIVDITATKTLIAGTAVAGFSGNGAAASLARFNNCVGIVVDTFGNVYVSDRTNNEIRIIQTTGKTATGVPQFGNVNNYAGSAAGTAGTTGNDGPATSALLNSQTVIAIDTANNIYILEPTAGAVGARIRKVAADGTITAFAGNGTKANPTLGLQATLSPMQFDTTANMITDASGNLYIANGTTSIYKISTDGLLSSIIAGISTSYITTDFLGSIYYSANNKVQRISPFLPVQLVPTPITMSALTPSNMTSTGFTLSWTGGTQADGVTSYSYYGAWPSIDNGLTSQTATFTGLVSTTTRTFTVTANKWGAPVTQQISIPAAAGNLTSTSITSNSFTLQVGTAAAGNPTFYNIYTSIDNVNFTLYNPTPLAVFSSTPITNQTPGALVYICVRAITGNFEYWPSPTLSVQLPPTAITNLNVNTFVQTGVIATTGFTISWSGGDGATSVTFTGYTVGTSTYTVNLLTKRAVFTGIDNSTSKGITVTATSGAAAAPLAYVYAPYIIPSSGAYTLGLSTPGPTSFNFSLSNFPYNNNTMSTWAGKLVSQNYSSSVYFYSNLNIYTSTDNTNFTLYTPPLSASIPSTTLTGTVPNLLPGALIYVYVKPVLGTTEMWAYPSLPPIAAVTQVQLTAPTTPAFVSASNFNATGFTITFSGGVGASSYVFKMTYVNNGVTSTAVAYTPSSLTPNTGANGSATFTGLIPGITYSGTIDAINLRGTASSASSVWATPAYTVAAINSGQITSALNGLTFDGGGNLYYFKVNSTISNQVMMIPNSGTLLAPTFTAAPTVIVGITTSGFAGDNGLATAATCGDMKCMVFDVKGNLYVSDLTNHRVRMIPNMGASAITPSFTGAYIYTVAGDGTKPVLGNPRGMAFDQYGNLYICMYDDVTTPKQSQIKIAPNWGYVNTPIINGLGSNMVVAIGGNGEATACVATDATNGDGGAATSGRIYQETGVSFDSSWNMYITEGCRKVRKITNAGTTASIGNVSRPLFGTISTLVGNGVNTGTPTKGNLNSLTAQNLATPLYTTFDLMDNAYILDSGTIDRVAPGSIGFSVIVCASYTSGGFTNSSLQTINATPTGFAFNSAGQLCFSNNTGSTIYALSGFVYPIPTLPVPNTPTNITGNGFNLSWTGGTGGVTYTFNYTSGSGPQPSYNPYKRTAIFTGLTALTTYAGTITATNAAGSTTSAASWTVTTLDAAPTEITNITYSNIGATTFTISWSGGDGATSYRFIYTTGNSASQPTVSGNSGVFVGTSQSTTYIGYLVATNAGGNTFSPLCVVTTTKYKISTIAGGGDYMGTFASTRTGGPKVYGFALDNAGNIYFAQNAMYVINKISITTGIVKRIAGTINTSGNTGDNGLATNATISNVSAIAIDSSNNIYIVDISNNNIRKFTEGGNITTIVSGLNQPTGIAIDSSGIIYYSDSYRYKIYKYASGTSTLIAGTGTVGTFTNGVQATAANIGVPYQLAIDSSNNIYFADQNANKICKFSVGGTISTIAGTGTSGASASGTLATSALLNKPTGIVISPSNTIYYSDSSNNRVCKFTVGGNITVVAGTGTAGFSGDSGLATAATLNNPYGMVYDSSGNIYISDYNNSKIRKFTDGGNIITMVGVGQSVPAGDGLVATSAGLWSPYGIAFDSIGNIYIADCINCRIRKFTASTNIITTIAGGNGAGFSGDGGLATAAAMYKPQGIVIDSSNNIYFSDSANFRIRKFREGGNISTIAGTGVTGSTDGVAASSPIGAVFGIAIDSSNNIYICDQTNYKIRKFTEGGNISTIVGTGVSGSTDGVAVSSPISGLYLGVAVDSSGNVYIADYGNFKIRMITASTGNISTIAGTGTSGSSGDGGLATAATLSNTFTVAIDSSRNIYVSDYANMKIRTFKVGGNISTIAGTGTAGYSGDGGLATAAMVQRVYGIAIHSSGKIAFADQENVIRMLQ